MGLDHSRRKFLQAGLALSAAGLASGKRLDAALGPAPEVVYRPLGKTGLKVSGVGYGIGFVPVPEVVSRALDLGVNYFDTARVYGDSEKIFSGVIKGRQRDKIVIATKSGSKEKDAIVKDLETSLKELGTDYVDVFHLHGRDKPEMIPDEALEGLETCKRSGKARFIGFSCHDPYNMADFAIKTGKIDVVQMTYSFPIGAIYRNKAIEKLHTAGIGVIAMKVVVALSGFNLKSVDNPPATKGEGPLAGIKWVLQNPGVSTTVPFMKTIPELEVNFRAMSEPYTPEDEKLLFSMNEQIRPDYCRMCYECRDQCPKGLQGTRQGNPGCALQRLFFLRDPVPQWRRGAAAADARSGNPGLVNPHFQAK
jgi:aryl-alcohol dehydrogenase-like predicted oxidoreductase